MPFAVNAMAATIPRLRTAAIIAYLIARASAEERVKRANTGRPSQAADTGAFSVAAKG